MKALWYLTFLVLMGPQVSFAATGPLPAKKNAYRLVVAADAW